MSTGTLGIVELGDVCARQRALSLDLFRELGAWVADADVEHQRWYATACHRHAWHAELWAQRSPTIPPVDLEAAVTDASRTRLPSEPDPVAYRSVIDRLLDELDRLSGRADPVLDPGTHRVLTLVRRDVSDLRNP